MARLRRHQGYNVLHPIGFDAFGLPAEQFAIQTGTHPRDTTVKNCNRFREQLQSLGFSYDWDREISTTDPEYYKCARGNDWDMRIDVVAFPRACITIYGPSGLVSLLIPPTLTPPLFVLCMLFLL